jgi:large subunit ribosomal protein L11
MVEGGKASAGPPLGPQLGPLGVKIPDVIAKINEKTKTLAGMQVPVRVIVNEDKSFSVEVGTPPVSALIKKELGLEKGSKEPGKLRAGDLTEEQVRKIARMKFDSEDKHFLNQVAGTARSMGIPVGQGKGTEEELRAYEEAKAAEEAAAEAAKEESPEGAEAPKGERAGEEKKEPGQEAAEGGEKPKKKGK